MKIIGKAFPSSLGPDTPYIVELSQDELHSLVRLHRSANKNEGTVEMAYRNYSPQADEKIDLTQALKVIDTFAKINALYNSLYQIEGDLLALIHGAANE